MRLEIATCHTLPEPDPDQPLLLDALDRAGIDARLLAWDAPNQPEPQQPAPVLLRSTWNYPQQPEAFLRWAEACAARAPLWNDLETLRWNIHKKYLLDLYREGFEIVPTVLVARGQQEENLAALMDAKGWDRVVIKPAISAGSFRTCSVDRRDADTTGQEALHALCADADALLQPYITSIHDYGERSLVWIDGDITHAIRKSPRFAGQSESVTESACPIQPDELRLARAVFASRQHLLYGRLDVVRLSSDPLSPLAIMELELIEPSLFLKQSPEALEKFVKAIQSRLTSTK